MDHTCWHRFYDLHDHHLCCIHPFPDLFSKLMISSDTPYKLREIIQATWPQLFRYEPQEKKTITEPKEEKDVYP